MLLLMKRKTLKILAAAAIALLTLNPPGILLADEDSVAQSLVWLPARYGTVDGHVTTFQAQQWMRDGYTGGIREFEYKRVFEDDSLLTLEGSLLGDDEMDFALELEQEDVYFVKLRYDHFTKFYDTKGGLWTLGDTFKDGIDLDKELALRIGHLEFEAGLLFEDYPDITFLYEYGFRDGAKSRTTWGEVEFINGDVKNIAPSFQEIDEVEQVLQIQADHEILGFNIRARQRWEFSHGSNMREERDYVSPARPFDPADRQIVRQYLKPSSVNRTSFVSAERWIDEESAFVGFAYQYGHLNSKELEDLITADESGNITNFSRVHQTRAATAHNELDTHTLVLNSMFSPFDLKNLQLITRVKTEHVKRDGFSTVPHYDGGGGGAVTPYDETLDHTTFRESDNNISRNAQSVAFRYQAFPAASLFGEAEWEQVRNFLSETSYDIAGASPLSAGEVWFRETLDDSRKQNFSIGGRWQPSRQVDMNTQFRYKSADNHYDHLTLSHPEPSSPQSAFIDDLDSETREVASKITLKPFRGVRGSLRHQYRSTVYQIMAREDDSEVETRVHSHVYTADLSVNPIKRLYLTGSYQKQFAVTETPARNSSTLLAPAFNAHSSTWLVMGDYIANEDLSLDASVQFTSTDNFMDFAAVGLPLGSDFDYLKLSLGARWKCTENITIEPGYAFYKYSPGSQIDTAEYEAHVIQVACSIDWPED